MKSKADYPPDAVEAARSVLVELVHILGEYRDDMVIVGGWVPPLLMPESTGHVGSTDVDIALNHLAENDEVYTSAALDGRIKEKDAYDIWFTLANYPGGISVVVAEFLPFATHGLVREACAVLGSKFSSPERFGPTSVSTFLEYDGEEAELVRRDAFERVQALLAGLSETGA